MAKINLPPVRGGFNLSQINSNFQKISESFDNGVLWRDNPPGEPNHMKKDLDMDSNRIYNLRRPVLGHEPVRLQDLATLGGGAGGAIGASSGVNVGNGVGVYKDNDDADLRFKTLVAGPNITIAPSENSITISSTGGGGGVQGAPPSFKVLGNFTMNQATPDHRVVFHDTNPTVWAVGFGTQTFDFQLTPNRYFEANPQGHLAIIGRCKTDVIATTLSGQGMTVGSVIGDEGNAAPFQRTSAIETWNNPNGAPVRWVFPATSGGPGALMQDGSRYRFILELTKNYDSTRTIRVRRYLWNTTWNAWDSEVDTGHVLDHNTNADLTQSGLAMGTVFESNIAPWSLVFTEAVVTWGPPVTGVDTRSLLSKFGGRVEGDLTMYGAARNFYLQTTGLPDKWTRFISKDAEDTKLLVSPNKAFGDASLFLTNTNSRTNISFLSVGTAQTYAVIHCGVQGTAAPLQELRIGYSENSTASRITFTPAGAYTSGSSLPLGKNPTILASILDLNGVNARNLANNSPFSMETPSTQGQLVNFFKTGNAFTTEQANALEGILRPLFATVSCAVGSARAKGTM